MLVSVVILAWVLLVGLWIRCTASPTVYLETKTATGGAPWPHPTPASSPCPPWPPTSRPRTLLTINTLHIMQSLEGNLTLAFVMFKLSLFLFEHSCRVNQSSSLESKKVSNVMLVVWRWNGKGYIAWRFKLFSVYNDVFNSFWKALYLKRMCRNSSGGKFCATTTNWA